MARRRRCAAAKANSRPHLASRDGMGSDRSAAHADFSKAECDAPGRRRIWLRLPVPVFALVADLCQPAEFCRNHTQGHARPWAAGSDRHPIIYLGIGLERILKFNLP